MYVNISINGCRTDWSQWKLLNDAIAQSMTESGIWNSLQYQPSLHIDNDENTGFKLNLKCQVIPQLQNDLSKIESLGRFCLLILNFNYNTPESKLSLPKLLESLHYLLASLILNLEYKFPLVFSVHGRKLLQNNYPWMITNINEVLSLQLENETSVYEKNRNLVLMKLISDLQKKTLNEFNTINIMKECDASSSRRKSCEFFKAKSASDTNYVSRTSIKNIVYSFGIINIERILSSLTK